MDLRPAIPAHCGTGRAVAGELVPGRQCQHRHRQGELLPARRRPADAGQEEPGAAGSALLPAATEVTGGHARAFFDLVAPEMFSAQTLVSPVTLRRSPGLF